MRGNRGSKGWLQNRNRDRLCDELELVCTIRSLGMDMINHCFGAGAHLHTCLFIHDDFPGRTIAHRVHIDVWYRRPLPAPGAQHSSSSLFQPDSRRPSPVVSHPRTAMAWHSLESDVPCPNRRPFALGTMSLRSYRSRGRGSWSQLLGLEWQSQSIAAAVTAPPTHLTGSTRSSRTLLCSPLCSHASLLPCLFTFTSLHCPTVSVHCCTTCTLLLFFHFSISSCVFLYCLTRSSSIFFRPSALVWSVGTTSETVRSTSTPLTMRKHLRVPGRGCRVSRTSLMTRVGLLVEEWWVDHGETCERSGSDGTGGSDGDECECESKRLAHLCSSASCSTSPILAAICWRLFL